MEKKLGFGCMRLPLLDERNRKSIDTDKFCSLIDCFLQNGYTYFDTAYFYHENSSESVVGQCLASRHKRSEFLLADKLPLVALETPEDMEKIFCGQLEECRVDYFDRYLLHNINSGTYQKAVDFKSFEFALKKKAEGKIKSFGFSFHGSPELLDEVLSAHPEAEFVQLQLNYLDWDDLGVQSRRLYETARRHGKDIIVMEPCKGGELTTLPDEALALIASVSPGSSPASLAFRFVLGLEGVVTVLSGMNSMEQLAENISVFDSARPLSDAESRAIKETVRLIEKTAVIKCTGCRYCESACPQRIPIPDCFSFYNRFERTGNPNAFMNYSVTVKGRGAASDCLSCRECVSKCPQSLEIPALLKQVSAVFDKPADEK